MPNTRLYGLLLIAPILCASIQSEAGDLPTQNYQQAALRPGVNVEAISKPIQIRSVESIATVSAVRLVTSDGESHPGARLSIDNASQAEDLYIGASDATQLREEFASFAKWRDEDLKCEAMSICVQGVARCSPSQGVRQAICPSAYSTPQGQRGVIISTADASFRFPSTQTSTFVAALDASLEQISSVKDLRTR